jgi:hypothetical protein
VIVHSDPITEARWRMTPDPQDVPDLAEHFAHLTTEDSCAGIVLAEYLVEVIEVASELHSAECRNRRCHTCAGIATARLGVAAHNHLYGHSVGEENP